MTVNKPDEWSEFRIWLNAQLEWLRCVEPQADLRLLEQARALFPAIGEADGATRAVAELERLADKAWSAEGTTMLRHYLGYALAARAVEVRRMLGPGGVVIVEGLADRILALDTCDSELDEFAEGLKRRAAPSEARAGRLAVPLFAALLLVFGVVPVVVGGLLGSTTLMSLGTLLAAALVAASVWVLRATSAHRRPAHLAPSVSRTGR
jgi:hypothetical protein